MACKMAQCVKVLVAKPNNRSAIPEIHIVEQALMTSVFTPTDKMNK